MRALDSPTVRGFLADDATGAGVGGLRVELWHTNGRGPELVAASESDAAGEFRMSWPAEIATHSDGGPVEVEWRVLDAGELVLSETRELNAPGDAEPVDLTIPAVTMPVEVEPDTSSAAQTYEVVGQVRGPVPEGATVQAVLRTLSHGTLVEDVVAEAVVNDAGWYRLRYPHPGRSPDRTSDTSLAVRLLGTDGDTIGESTPVLSPSPRSRVDVFVGRAPAGPSEFARLQREVAGRLESGLDGIESADESVLEEVSEWLDVDADRLSLLQRARALERDTSVPGDVFYALGRGGLGTTLEDLTDVPVHELRTTIEEAVADGIVDGGVLADLEAHTGRLADAIVQRATAPDARPARPGLAEVLAAADLPREAIESTLRKYQARSTPPGDFWDAAAASGELAEDVGGEGAQQIEVAIRLGEVLGPDPPLLRQMHERRRAGEWQRPEDLTRYSFDDWCDLLEQAAPAAAESSEGIDEDDNASLVEARAEVILDTLEEEYPNEFIRRTVFESERSSGPARQLIERAPDHDFHKGSIRERIAREPQLIEGLDAGDADAAIEEIEAVERVSRVADRADDIDVLVSTGMRSAMDIASTPRRQFIDVYAEALGGREQASRVHAQAQQAAAASKFASVRLLQAHQRVPFVLGAPPPPDIKGVPDARTLFQAAGGFCDCEHCGSVYSPAAYFVDLLRYLNVSSPDRMEQIEKKLQERTTPGAVAKVKAQLSRRQPLDVLLARRPDLAHLPLTCENTLTALPYIDLVNELLEATITGGSAAFNTGKTPTDVLQAVPQNLSRDAYQRLQEAVFPLVLPYHQPLALARAYLAHLGVTRLELMQALGKGEALRVALVAEALGMSGEEFAFVARPPAEAWRHFGFAAEQQNGEPFWRTLAHVPAFLDATGISFQDLIDLVDMRFFNADRQLTLDTPSPDCNPDVIRIAGLDAARATGMIRLIRLRRRLGWSFANLDQALRAFGATDLDPEVLEKLTVAKALAQSLDRPLPELLALWAPIDSWAKDNLFDRLFKTRAVLWRAQDDRAFQLRPDQSELAATGESLDGVASALLAAFRITSEELSFIRALLTRRGAEPKLDLAGLSAVYRVVVLSRALQLRIPALDLLLRLVPPDADPFRLGDPIATRRFVEIAREVQASEFTPERLAYLFRHELDPRRDPGPLSAQVEAVLASIRRGLADAFAETSPPTELTSEALRQKLALVLDAGLLDQAIDALDPRSQVPPAKRREFFDRHLAKMFPDPAAAAARLLEAVPEGTPREALSGRWRAAILFVLERLLPRLRARQTRGAVVQTLSDTLGLSIPATARLLDTVLRSRQTRGAPLLDDFLAMLGTGLTGAYFAKNDLSGEPAVVQLEPGLTFSWAGAVPATGVPAANFSARFTGRFLPQTKAPHIFYVTTDGAARLVLTLDGKERVLIDQAAAAGKPAEHTSEPVALEPGRLVEMRLEYRNAGAPAALALQFGTGPGARQPVPTTALYPADGLSSFAPVDRSYRRLHKAALILTGFGMTDAQLEWLTADPPYLNLDALPMDPAPDTEAIPLFQRWRQLNALYALRKTLPRSNADLFDVFRATTLPEAIERLVLATGWDRSVVEAFAGPNGLGIDSPAALRPPASAGEDAPLLRLSRAIAVHRRVGVEPATLFAWANTMPDADAAAAIVQSVKARYDEKRWLEVARSLNDPLRAERRDALVAYLLPRLRDRGIQNRNQLFEYFLVDVDMNPCMLTSRVRQATAAVQTFFQRALMNLETQVPPRVIDDNDWKWMKNYRVWEANRKVFLYPENWIEPELRDDKSPLFQVMERTILQQEIKNDNVEAAFSDYLEGLDEVARLDVRGVWFEARQGPRMARPSPTALRIPEAPRSEWDQGTYHVFARTFNAPHAWYYRRLENGRTWTAWEKIDADIEGEHLVPVVFQRRMHLFWTQFREVSKPTPALDRKTEGPPPSLGKDWEISLAYTVYDRGKWSRKRLSSGGVVDFRTFGTIKMVKKKPQVHVEGSRGLAPSDYTLRATLTETGDLPQLHLHLFCRVVDRVEPDDITRSPTNVELVARFALNGCQGALVPDRHRVVGRAIVYTPPVAAKKKKGRVQAAMGTVRTVGRTRPFRIKDGGVVNAPAGYEVHGMSFAGSRAQGGALLALPSGDGRGVAVALARARGPRAHTNLVAVTDPKHPETTGLYPFFFQDQFRSYFVRPIYADWRPPRLVAVPVLARPQQPGRPSPAGKPRPVPKSRAGGRGRREDIDEVEVEVLPPEGQDAWEDAQDDAWHPDDAAEARKPRKRERPKSGLPAPRPQPAPAKRAVGPARPAPAAAQPARQMQLRREGGFHERRLQFTPFEHPDTCRFRSTLKAKGIDGLLAFRTTRPRVGRDHVLSGTGTWALRGPTWFQQHYGAGPLVYAKSLPHLDVDFEVDHPYAAYNWELFFHAPLQIAVRLAKDGRHEEAQRWFHFIFDPTTDSSSPSPRRYWRFAPFYENNEYESARDLLHVLAYSGTDPQLTERNVRVRAQLSAWWEKPFSPHVIARLRIGAYQKAVVMKYIDNLLEWGDKLFRRDSMESIQEATQIYILAANILGPRPEKIPPIVSKPPLTFHQMRPALDLFSNVEVRMENLQVRRPFRVTARPETGGATAVLSMATQYFCTPPNPQLDKYWDTVADRLFKIRNCMNIQGIVRQLALFDPPIDPGLLVRAAAAGVDLGSVIASLNAPPPNYRFRHLLARATRLAEEIRTFGAMAVQVLERRDAEGLASLRASNETALTEAVRDIRKKQVRQVEEELAELSLQREHVEVQMQFINTQLQQLMNPQEQAQQQSLSAAQVVAGIAEGVDLVAKVMHAIPEFQTGAAGGFSSPFVTLQLGGQMFGDIASAFAASYENIKNKNEAEAELAALQAEYQRRREEWQHELDLLAKEKARVEKHIAEVQLKLEISSAELRRRDLEVENAKKVGLYLRDKYTNEQLYGWMLGQLSGVYFQAYKVAFDAAQQAERAFRFERGESSSSFIEFSYWDSLKKGLFAGERLLVDLRRLEAAHLDGDRRSLEITRHISLRDDYPLALLELLETGRCQIEVSEALLDGDFPGHYFRRLKTVSVTIAGAAQPHRNVNCTLTLLENRIRTDANASGSYAQSADAEDSRFLVNAAPVQAVATSTPTSDAGLFQLRFDDDRYLPFEGAGAVSTWRLELHQSDNALDLSQVSDVIVTIAYTARTGGAALEAAARGDREKALARGGLKPEARHLISLKRDLPDAWKQIQEAPAGQEVVVTLPLDVDRLSGRYRGLDLRIERASVVARVRGTVANDALRVRLDPPKGSGTPVGGWAPAWARSRALRATAEAAGPAGPWKLALTSAAKPGDTLDDLVVVFDVRAKKS